MIDAAFHVSGATRRLNERFRLYIDQLSAPRGQVLALVGPTGAGKTTLLRLLTGLEQPDEGVIEFNGAALGSQSPPPVLRDITMVHQRPILLEGSVESNVAFGLRARGLPAESKVKAILHRLGLSHLARHNARLLSGGQTQLVALARALVLEPLALLLDEPTANLDPAYVALVENVIAETRAVRTMTVVWATHNLFQAARVCASAGLLLDGRLIEVAANDHFFSSPKDARTKQFIEGKMVY